MQMIRGIFFDLYGTLFVYGDMNRAWAKWLNSFYFSLREHGLVLSKDDFSNVCDRFFSKDEPESTEQHLTVLEKRMKSLCSSLDITMCDADIRAVADVIADAWQEEITLDPHCIPILDELKEAKTLALVSSFDHPRHGRKWDWIN